MTTIASFKNRLKKIGIDVSLSGNYPWIYMISINGKPVKGKYLSRYHFTVFFRAIKIGESDKITDISIIFNKIRETLNIQK